MSRQLLAFRFVVNAIRPPWGGVGRTISIGVVVGVGASVGVSELAGVAAGVVAHVGLGRPVGVGKGVIGASTVAVEKRIVRMSGQSQAPSATPRATTAMITATPCQIGSRRTWTSQLRTLCPEGVTTSTRGNCTPSSDGVVSGGTGATISVSCEEGALGDAGSRITGCLSLGSVWPEDGVSTSRDANWAYIRGLACSTSSSKSGSRSRFWQ